MSAYTNVRPVDFLMRKARLINSPKDSPKILKVNIRTDRLLESAKARSCVVEGGDLQRRPYIKEKTILLVGSVGAGKSTIVDAIINYVVGVNFEDPHRLKLVDLTQDEAKNIVDGSDARTGWITCYTIPLMKNSAVPFTLRIIDTPGFGDNADADKDLKLANRIRDFFSKDGIGCQFMDAVCFVIRATDKKLTESQTYIFSSLQTSVGKDVRKNIFPLVTFCEDKQPAALTALQKSKIPYSHSNYLNNGSLFMPTIGAGCSDPLGRMFWKMTVDSLSSFFAQLTLVESRSLQLGKERLAERKLLEESLENMKKDLNEEIRRCEIMRNEKVQIVHLWDVDDFTIETNQMETVSIRTKSGLRNANNCIVCQKTCHWPCMGFTNMLARRCKIMEKSMCKVCGHQAAFHESATYRLEAIQRHVVKSRQQLGEQYITAERQGIRLDDAIQAEIDSSEATQLVTLERLVASIDRLNELTAMRDHVRLADYLEWAISAEVLARADGFMERVRGLHSLQEKVQLREIDDEPVYQNTLERTRAKSDR